MLNFAPNLLRSAGGALAAFVAVLGPVSTQAEPVDVELVLAVDVSLSMSPSEIDLQRQGYANALTHESVLEVIKSGMHGKIAVTYVEWAGETFQRVLAPWTVISNRDDAKNFTKMLKADQPSGARRTSISAAITFATALFDESDYEGTRRVLDISGDGPNNQGPPVAQARDKLTSIGVTINGLPLMTTDGLTSSYDVKDLNDYYERCVVGGPGAFVIPVNDWKQFSEAVRRKLVLELAGIMPRQSDLPIIKVQSESGPAFDCMIGEKNWKDPGDSRSGDDVP